MIVGEPTGRMRQNSLQRVRMHVTGQVQGVGFRPYVYRLARSMGLTGFVLNDPGGATVEVQGPGGEVEAFARRLPAELPPLARIRNCVTIPAGVVEAEGAFEIRPSTGGELIDAQVTVDTATCADCLRELADPEDPRYRYPFINCTNCGPRYTITERIPYDRPNTTMAEFDMCPLCAREYADPADRRFHAQPIACPACGPHVWLVDGRGDHIAADDPIAAAAEMIRHGKIVALKGLGGFHIACRADDEHVVGRLRRRKHRDAKPFALMVRDLDQARQLCDVDEQAAELLSGPIRPIVLLTRRRDARVARSVAPGLNTLGVMLPYTPLHHLLMGFDLPPLVMTSGNVADEPLTRDNEDAVAHLSAIADTIGLHNRRITRSVDDSVVQARDSGPVVFRRARGYAPAPILVGSEPSPVILAVGGELKSAVCLYRDGRGALSEHVGDLADGRTYRRFMRVINDMEALLDLDPEAIAADLHPHYLSTEYAMRRSGGQLAGKHPLPLVRVQHHHAHAVACMAEHGRTDECIGIVADGTGYGTDGAVWGCEILRSAPAVFQRLGHLRYFPLPGGDAASIETARPAMALLVEAFGKEAAELAVAKRLVTDAERRKGLLRQIDSDVNCPEASSLGRLFDAVAALAGVAGANRYEGQAPMMLESLVDPGVSDSYPVVLTDADPFVIDHRPITAAIVADVDAGTGPAIIAARFHNTVATFLLRAAEKARWRTGLNTVALSGGCMANRVLSAKLEGMLAEAKFEVLTHRQVPCNDGCVALGQAVTAARRLARRRHAVGKAER